ncbi:MAG TPA: TAXI family TRAP transporter solute-binding subunit [Methylotenera sp.]|nr:TAXI family TRAP transporter solute-binding subunit [Methylotenera sp.]
MEILKTYFTKIWAKLTELYGNSIIHFLAWMLGLVAILCVVLLTFINTAAPTSLTMAAGEDGSVYQKYALKYQKILARQGVTLTIIPSNGSIENLNKLTNKQVKVDVGFVQSGVSQDIKIDKLMSLGSVAYQPIFVFYRGESKDSIADFAGHRLNIGEPGSGTHALALTMLKENGILPGADTKLIETPSANPVNDLLEEKIDAIFVMGDSASVDLIKTLVKTPGINIFNFAQADGYTKRIKYLHKLVLPEGSLDLGKNIPVNDLNLVAPTVELIARNDLHPALSDLLLDAAQEVHGKGGLFVKAGEFPNLTTQEFQVSADAIRYYKSGKSFLYRDFPFWMASFINRILVIIVPLLLILVPAIKLAPSVYRWKIQLAIYPFYRALLELEKDAFGASLNETRRQKIMDELDQLEAKLSKIKIPAAFADMFYGLRGHINFVRTRLLAEQIVEDSE